MRATTGERRASRRPSDGGFTLIELLVVVLVIGVLVAIAVPILRGAASHAEVKTCYSNQRVMESAYSQYLANAGMAAAASITEWDELTSATVPAYVSKEPVCPDGGEYSWSGHSVSCTIHGVYH
jgi:prepilin-type N-terminal cleavage/methylation domain-containing protein